MPINLKGRFKKFELRRAIRTIAHNLKPRKKVKILFVCGIGEGSSDYFRGQFFETLDQRGISRGNFEVYLGRSEYWDSRTGKYKPRPPEMIGPAIQRYDYIIVRFEDHAENYKNALPKGAKTKVLNLKEAASKKPKWSEYDFGDKTAWFLPVIEEIEQSRELKRTRPRKS